MTSTCLVVDVDALRRVHVLDLVNDVAQRRIDIGETQKLVRIDGALGELLADLDGAHVGDARHELCACARLVFAHLAILVVDGERTAVLGRGDLQRAGNLGQDGETLGLACLEKLGNTRKTLRDVLARDTAGVEGAHRELGARLAMDCAAMMPAAVPRLTGRPAARSKP